MKFSARQGECSSGYFPGRFFPQFMFLQLMSLAVCLLLVFAPAPVSAQAADEISDPIESVNRGIFWFNDKFDIYIFEPVARGYDSIVPDPIQEGIGNFFDNLRYPSYLLSDIVQFKFTQAGAHTGRFLINSTVGILGFIDVAKHFGLERHVEDFGIALAYHGVPPGPYLVLPILGPSNLRDGVGKIVDYIVDPFTILSYTSDDDIVVPIVIGAKVLDAVDTRANLLEAIETAKESSVDYYLFMQSAYYQYRRGLLYDGNPPEEEDEPFGVEYGEGTPEVFGDKPDEKGSEQELEEKISGGGEVMK